MKKLLITTILLSAMLSTSGCGAMLYHDLCNQPSIDKSKLSIPCN